MNTRAVIAVVALVALAGCASSVDGTSTTTLERIQTLTGASAPLETVAAQRARGPGILTRADSLLASTLRGETSHPDIPELTLRARCAGTRCDLSDPRIGYSETLRLSDLETINIPREAIGTRNGVTLILAAGRAHGADYTLLGAWMQHSAFQVEDLKTVSQGYSIGLRGGIAGGDLTGTRPTGGATWLGVMVGTPATGARRGDRLQGVAALNYVFETGTLDVAFSSIKNIDRIQDHPTSIVQFSDVPVAAGGTFEAGFTGNRIQGGFYGPQHAEATGVFEQSNIVGAFGAKRQ